MLSQRNMKKCKFILKHIGLLTVSNVFSLKLRENSNVFCVYPQLGGFTAPQGNSYDVSASAQTSCMSDQPVINVCDSCWSIVSN